MTKAMLKRKTDAPALDPARNSLPDWAGLTGTARLLALKAYFDSLTPEEEERQLRKLSGADLHSLVCATIAERPEATV